MSKIANADSTISVAMSKSSLRLVGYERIYEAPKFKERPYLASIAITIQSHLNFNFLGGC
jgi:hypothetical protein